MSPRPTRGTRRRPATARMAFSLVELLTVVGIIALLIGILLPAMSGARTEARRGATKAFLASCERGLEMFNTDFGQYPNSQRRLDPVKYADDGSSDAPYLSGAHWLARAMIGHDSNGVDYGAKTVDDPRSPALELSLFRTDTSPPGVYSKRRKPYVDNAKVKLDKDLAMSDPDRAVPRRSVFVDDFEHPILYYRANSRQQLPFAETASGSTKTPTAIYMQEDNAEITGGKVLSGSGSPTPVNNGWVLTASSGKAHGMGQFGVNTSNGNLTVKADDRPDRKGLTFAGMLHNASAMQTGKTLKPVKESSYVLLSPGPDGVFGSPDDVTNFK